MVSLDFEQLRQFHDQGFLALPGLFAFDEIAWVRDEAQAVALRSTARGSWPDEAPEGTIYGADANEDVFGRLARHTRILGAASALIGNELYIHQSRLLTWRAPARSEGRLVRDFSSWAALDGMRKPHAATAAVLLEDAAYEPALSVVTGSHRQEGLSQGGSQRLVPVAGGTGSVVFLDANLAYVLGPAGDRPHHRLFLISFNRLDNQPGHPRGDPYSALKARAPLAEADDSLWPAPWCAAG